MDIWNGFNYYVKYDIPHSIKQQYKQTYIHTNTINLPINKIYEHYIYNMIWIVSYRHTQYVITGLYKINHYFSVLNNEIQIIYHMLSLLFYL